MIDPKGIELVKKQLESQLIEYQREIEQYAVFMKDWRERNDPAHQRVRRFREASKTA